MPKQKLKELMKDQISTITEDIQKKIEYLTDGDLFNYNYYKIDIYRQKLNFTQDDDLLNAFIKNTGSSSTNEENAFVTAFMNANPEAIVMQPQHQAKKDLRTDERIKKLRSRINALRGTSMPGGYLNNPD